MKLALEKLVTLQITTEKKSRVLCNWKGIKQGALYYLQYKTPSVDYMHVEKYYKFLILSIYCPIILRLSLTVFGILPVTTQQVWHFSFDTILSTHSNRINRWFRKIFENSRGKTRTGLTVYSSTRCPIKRYYFFLDMTRVSSVITKLNRPTTSPYHCSAQHLFPHQPYPYHHQ